MGGKPPAQTTSTTKQELSPEQKQIFDLAMPNIKDYAASPIQAYSGQTVAGFNPTQQQAQQMYTGAVPGVNNLGTQSADAQSMMLNSAQLDPNSNPYLSGIADQIAAKGTSNLLENILPKIRAGSISAGSMYGGGSTRGMLAEGTAVGDTTAGIADAQQQLYFNAYNSGLDRIQKAQQLNPTVQAQQLFGADVLGAVGGQQQAMEQAFLTDAANRWNLEQHLPYLRSAELMQFVNGMAGGGTTTQATGALPTANPITSALGGAASGAALGAAVPVVGAPIGALLGALAGYGSTKL